MYGGSYGACCTGIFHLKPDNGVVHACFQVGLEKAGCGITKYSSSHSFNPLLLSKSAVNLSVQKVGAATRECSPFQWNPPRCPYASPLLSPSYVFFFSFSLNKIFAIQEPSPSAGKNLQRYMPANMKRLVMNLIET